MFDNIYKKKCCTCLKIIGKKQKSIECITCHKWYHAKPACVISLDNAEIELCKNCIDNVLPFQSLDDLEYELNITKQRNFSQEDIIIKLYLHDLITGIAKRRLYIYKMSVMSKL
jgi:hypothetical protein